MDYVATAKVNGRNDENKIDFIKGCIACGLDLEALNLVWSFEWRSLWVDLEIRCETEIGETNVKVPEPKNSNLKVIKKQKLVCEGTCT